jgi:hypothetical protein
MPATHTPMDLDDIPLPLLERGDVLDQWNVEYLSDFAPNLGDGT